MPRRFNHKHQVAAAPEILTFITRDYRIGEVCMVLQRPDGRIWCAAKQFYFNHTARLLTGGIHPGEDLDVALHREVAEETGLSILSFTPAFTVSYKTTIPFFTWVFHCQVSADQPVCHDPHEQIHHFEALAPHELIARGDALTHLPDEYTPHLGGTWRAWGSFRAQTHYLLADYLGHGG